MRLWLPALAIWALASGITTQTTLWDRDEPRFARAALEMARTGDWLVPRFEGVPRTAKPPMAYWLMAIAMRAAGSRPVACRFWSPVALALAGLFTALIARRLGAGAAAVRAMCMTTLAPLPLVEGTAATADALLLAAIAGSLLAGLALLQDPRKLLPACGLLASLTIAQLTKGPVGLVVPVGVIAVLAARRRDPAFGRRGWIVLAATAGLSLAIFGVWLARASEATGGRFLTEFVGGEVFGRALHSREGHGTPWFVAPIYYPVVLAIGFLPWSFYMPAALRRARDGWRAGELLSSFALAGIAVPVVLFTLAATKLPHYVLPAFPPMAVLCASASMRSRRRFSALLASAVAVVLLIAAIVLPAVERRKAIPDVARIALDACGGSCDAALAGIDEPSLIFLLDRPSVTRLESPRAAAAWLEGAGSGVLVARAEQWDAFPDATRRAGTELARRRGLDVVHGGQMTLVVVSRGAR